MDDFELELKVGFLQEAQQLLDDAESLFLELESQSENPAVIESIFRLAHNLKGSSRAVGFAEIAEFTHVFESILLKIKNKELQINTPTVTLLLQCNDHLRGWVDALKGDISFSMDSTDLMNSMNAVLSGQVEAAPAVDTAVAESSATEAPANELPVEATSTEAAPPVESVAVEAQNEAPSQEFDPFAAPQMEEAPPVEAMPIDQFPPADAFAEDKVQEVKPEVITTKPAPKAALKEEEKKAATDDETIRVSLRRLESLINNVGELVILQTVLNQQRSTVASPLLQRTIVQLAKITKDIQDTSMSLRMVPLRQTFQKMQRIVRDTSKTLGKEINFEISGEQTEMDKTVVDQLGDPLVHLIRNAVDHGIEDPQGRVSAGKPNAGRVSLAAYHRGGKIIIEVKDDGKGLDTKKLVQKAIEKKIIPPNSNLSEREALQLIFAPGFSTKSEVTEVSGRGVGMDVVKTNIEKKLSGEINVITEVGKGSTFQIALPLTLAIIDGMVVKIGDERYIVPLSQVFESLQPKSEDVHYVTGLGEVLSLRGEQLAMMRLSSALGRKTAQKPATDCIAIVVRSGDQPFSVLVDDILGQQQIVIKQLGAEFANLKGVTGGAILGDGKAALILDLNELAAKSAVPAVAAARAS